MDKDAQIMKMGLIIKACINATCLFTRKVFDGTEVPGKKERKHNIFQFLKTIDNIKIVFEHSDKISDKIIGKTIFCVVQHVFNL